MSPKCSSYKTTFFALVALVGCSSGLPDEHEATDGVVEHDGTVDHVSTGADGGSTDDERYDDAGDSASDDANDSLTDDTDGTGDDNPDDPEGPAGDAGSEPGTDAEADSTAPDSGEMESGRWWDPNLPTVGTPLSGTCDETQARYIAGDANTNYVARPGMRKAGTCGAASLYEPNELPDDACSIVLGELVSSELSGGADLIDHYTAQVEKGVTYTLVLTRSADLTRSVFLPVGAAGPVYLPNTTLFSSGTTAEPFTPDRSGALLIRVSGRGNYSLRFLPDTDHGLLHDSLTFEPNDSSSAAAPICVGTEITSEVLGPIDQTDFYRVHLDANTTYTLRLHRSGDLTRGITMSSGGQLRTLPDFGWSTLFGAGTTYNDFVPPVTGLATLQLQGRLYRATILPGTDFGMNHDPVTFEPNDTANLAMPLALGTEVSSEFASSDDIADVFRTEVEAGASYMLDIVRTGDITRYAFLLRDGVEKPVFPREQTYYSSGETHEPFTAPASGLVYIRVAAGNGISYKLRVSKR